MINKKNILFISLFISILLTAAITFYLYNSIYPLELELKHEKKHDIHGSKYMVYDYDKDGRSEWFQIANREYENRATIMFYMDENVLIDEFSVQGRTDIGWLSFDDINGDNKEDLIMFSINEDKIFLTIINLHTNQYIKREEFLLGREENNKQYWDLNFHYVGIINNKLYVFIAAGYSLKPRLYLSYDLQKDLVVDRFI